MEVLNSAVKIIDSINMLTPTLLLVGIIFYLIRYRDRLDNFADSIRGLSRDLQDMKSRITFKDTCEDRHANIDRRIAAIEKKVFD